MIEVKGSPMHNFFKGMLIALPLVVPIWIRVYLHPRSHHALVVVSVLYVAYIAFVVGGFFLTRKGGKDVQV